MAVISRLVLIKLLLVLLLVVGALGSSYSAESPRTARSALTQAPSPSPTIAKVMGLFRGRRAISTPPHLFPVLPVQQIAKQTVALSKIPQLFATKLVEEAMFLSLAFLGIEALLIALERHCPKLMYAIFKTKLPNVQNECDKEFVEAAQLALEEAGEFGHGVIHLKVDHSDTVQAYVWGGNFLSYPTVTFSRKLLELRLPKEVTAAIVLHEFGHVKRRHSWSKIRMACVLSAVSKVAQNLTQYELREKVGKRDKAIQEINDPRVLILSPGSVTFPKHSLFVVRAFICTLTFLTKHIELFLSRRNEYEADAFAGDVIGENAMILALQAVSGVSPTLIKMQFYTGFIIPTAFLQKISKHDFFKVFTSTHPSTASRIQALMKRRDREGVKYSEGDLVMPER